MKNNRIATAVMALTMAFGMTAASSVVANAQEVYTAPELQKAYNDGVMAAKLDKAAKRPIDATQSHLYKNVPKTVQNKDAYREAFVKGYKATTEQSGL